jgi:hypothetical protein
VRQRKSYHPSAEKRGQVRAGAELAMKDQISIPPLRYKEFRKLIVCCEVQHPDKPLLAKLRSLATHPMIARISTDGYVEVFGGGGVPNHLHINLCRGKMPPAKRRDTVTAEKARKFLELFVDKRLKIDITALFLIPLKQLPAHGLVKQASAQTKYAGLSVKQSSQRLRIVDGPIEELAWAISPDEQSASVQIGAEGVNPFYGEMFADLAFFMWRMFNYLILEEKADVFARLS